MTWFTWLSRSFTSEVYTYVTLSRRFTSQEQSTNNGRCNLSGEMAVLSSIACTAVVGIKFVGCVTVYTLLFHVSAVRSLSPANGSPSSLVHVGYTVRPPRLIVDNLATVLFHSEYKTQDARLESYDEESAHWPLQVSGIFKRRFFPKHQVVGDDDDDDDDIVCDRRTSCAGRCLSSTFHENPPTNRFSCRCDALCALYNDCCRDFFDLCHSLDNVIKHYIDNGRSSRLACVHIPQHDLKYIQMVASCPEVNSFSDRRCREVLLNDTFSSLPVVGKSQSLLEIHKIVIPLQTSKLM